MYVGFIVNMTRLLEIEKNGLSESISLIRKMNIDKNLKKELETNLFLSYVNIDEIERLLK